MKKTTIIMFAVFVIGWFFVFWFLWKDVSENTQILPTPSFGVYSVSAEEPEQCSSWGWGCHKSCDTPLDPFIKYWACKIIANSACNSWDTAWHKRECDTYQDIEYIYLGDPVWSYTDGTCPAGTQIPILTSFPQKCDGTTNSSPAQMTQFDLESPKWTINLNRN